MTAPQGNALIGQSGGPTAVINQSLVGLVEACMQAAPIREVYGAINGIQGVLDERFVNLGLESPADLERVAQTPAAALRSVRKKPSREDSIQALEVLRVHDVRYFFYIGGNDSAETAHLLNGVAVEQGYDVRLFHVPKTIDNDLLETDHCPGYGSAAKFVAQALMGDNEDNRGLGGIKIDVIMGRNAGWLTAAGALARIGEGEGPHLIYLPEVDFTWDGFLDDIARNYEEHGRCLVAVSEGIHTPDGALVAQSKEQDAFGNAQLSGSGSLGDLLASRVKQGLGARFDGPLRVRADTFGYLQRSFHGLVSSVDAAEAREVGRAAVRVATSDDVPHGSIIIRREGNGSDYRASYDWCPLEKVARETKEMPAEFLRGSNDVSPAFLDYARPLVGDLPPVGRLSDHPVPKRR
jgi:ATP-dependent phosphofructokinase / diphosphate-dependent phosphofructokinase